ncbi:MAG: polysaccharide export protein [Beijerinckiaceae bacterium]|nr:polysaccharide export protein [Beijerinckiaceae bacterium]
MGRPHSSQIARAMFGAALALALAGCGPGGDPMALSDGAAVQPAGEARTVSAPANLQASAQATSAGVYRVTTGDVLEVAVYQVQDLNRVVEVDGAGNVVLPLIGVTPAAGRTVRELETDISRKLDARYVRSPQVSVFVKDSAGLRVTIEGAVKKPGVIVARGQMTLLQAIAEAQGFGETADMSAVMVFRNTPSGRLVSRHNASAIRSGAEPDPVIYGRDTIVVDDSTAKTAWKYFREAAPAAGLLRVF